MPGATLNRLQKYYLTGGYVGLYFYCEFMCKREYHVGRPSLYVLIKSSS